jgi:pimeloyl-ACP methyl ester carboxylesterase
VSPRLIHDGSDEKVESFQLKAADGNLIRGDRLIGKDRQILFITGFLSKRWGNKSKALAEWCRERGWGFCCYDVRGFGDSEGRFTDYTLSDWIEDARTVLRTIQESFLLTRPPQARRDAPSPGFTLVGNSLGSWIAWLVAQEFPTVDELILIARAFNMMGEGAKHISDERRQAWRKTGWMPWDDDALHKDWPLSWKWVEESERYWAQTFSQLQRVKTTILHGLQDMVITPDGSRRFVEELLRRDPEFPVTLLLPAGDHRLSSREHLETFRRLVVREPLNNTGL